MNRNFKWLGALTVLLIGTLVVVWINREPVALWAVAQLMERKVDAGPFREITWDSGEGAGAAEDGEQPPNIIMIVADDLGWNDITLNGGIAGGSVATPHIDSIAQQGVTFRNGYAANGTCAPSRAAIMSGRYGTRFGFEFTPTPKGMMPLTTMGHRDPQKLRRPIPHDAPELEFEDMGMPGSEITIAELLSDEGYHTVHIGKWHLGSSTGMHPRDQGFDESLHMASGLYLPEDHPDVVNSRQDFDPIDRFLWAAMKFAVEFDGEVFEPDIYQTDYFTREAVRSIEANKSRPFFMYLAYWAPHTPLQALRKDYEALSHIDSHRERVYGAMVRSLDRGIGEVLAALKQHGIDDNTLVLFTSDNGGAGYIGIPEVNQPYRGWKITLFEGGIHVPFFARWPDRISPGSIFDAPVQHFDLFATAAAAGGAALPADRVVDGVDLLPYVSGDAQGIPHRELFWSSGASKSALVEGWKLNVSDPPGRSWLFNLKEDPTEQHDLSVSRPEKLAELRAALARHQSEQASPAWPSQASFPVNIDKDLSLPDAEDDAYIYWSN
ncbi:MAG: sulfatase-like hydrolase/transferase [Pseudomonadota bacterium]